MKNNNKTSSSILEHQSNNLYPWLNIHYNNIKYLIDNNKLSQSILLYGPEGLGKSDLAYKIASLILTNKSESDSFSEADSLVYNKESFKHPDLHIINNNKDPIKIDQIRSILDSSSKTGLISNRSVFIILSADNLNMSAANALLKTLESGNSSSYFILVSSNYSKVLPTIISRCYKVNVGQINNYDQISDWLTKNNLKDLDNKKLLLELANNAPLKALDYYNKDYLTKIIKVKSIIENVNKYNILASVKEASEIFETYKDPTLKSKAKKVDIIEFINLTSFLLSKYYLDRYDKKLFNIINKYKINLSKSIPLDSNNIIYKVLFVLAHA